MIAPLVRTPGDHKGRPYSSHNPHRLDRFALPTRPAADFSPRAAIVAVTGVAPGAAQPASGFGLICSLNTLGCASTPPSPWKLVRVPDVVHRPLPCQPPFGSSMRPSAFLVKKPIG